MPLYEFSCEKCGKVFEELVSGESRTACPKCGDSSTKRLFSAFAISTPSTKQSLPQQLGPCGSCGHPDGPGSCALKK